MRNLYFIFLLIAICNAAHSQTIRIADNNVIRPTGTNVYSTLQAAINAAQPDDIVYITPSETSYGNISIAKRLTLQGVGFNTGLPNGRNSTVAIITLISSSDGVNSVSGSVLRQFYFSEIRFSDTGIGTPVFDNITIEKVSTGSISNGYYNVSNWTAANRVINNLIVRNSIISSFNYSNPYNTASLPGLTNTKIYNNVFSGNGVTLGSSIGVMDNIISGNIFENASATQISIDTQGVVNNTLLVNNIFSGSGNAFYQLDKVICSNNIFYGKTPGSDGYRFRDNTFSNNLITSTVTMPPPSIGGSTNNGIGNITGSAPGFLSVAGTAWNSAYDYSLVTSSSAKNAGTDGTDIGPTGGAYPINKNIVLDPAALPLITELNTSGVIPQNQPLKVNLKAKSN